MWTFQLPLAPHFIPVAQQIIVSTPGCRNEAGLKHCFIARGDNVQYKKLCLFINFDFAALFFNNIKSKKDLQRLNILFTEMTVLN